MSLSLTRALSHTCLIISKGRDGGDRGLERQQAGETKTETSSTPSGREAVVKLKEEVPTNSWHFLTLDSDKGASCLRSVCHFYGPPL